MMFSATMSAETRALCKKFMQDPHEIRVDEESKLTLHGLLQYYVKLTEKEKNRKLNDLLDALEFNQVVIFVKSVQRAVALDKLLVECNFPSIAIHSGLQQEDRIARYKQFKEFQKRIMVSTDLFGRGIDIERVNIVINYDMPDESDSYLHRVGRAGRFGTKGLAITFVATEEDQEVLNKVQERFEWTLSPIRRRRRSWRPEMAPGGRREGGHGAWVKKAPAGGEKKDEETESQGFKGKEGKGKGRSKGERSRRDEDQEAKGKGRAKGKQKKDEGRESNSGEDEAEDGGNALLKMLKGNGQTTKRFSYTKAELLNIARLPSSNIKPPELDPIVDKDNKDSVLLIRIATGREKEEQEANGEDRRRNSTRQARAPEAEGAAHDTAVPAGVPAEAEGTAEDDDEEEKARAFEKWLGRNMPKLEAAKADLTAKAAAAGSATSGSTMTAAAPKWPPTASAMAAALANASGKSGSNYMSLLQQQAGASGSASGMTSAQLQAAAYMQAMTQMQVAAAAARNSYGSQWNAYNQYLNPYMSGAYSGYGMDPFAAAASQAAASNLTEAMQAKLGVLQQQARSMATAKAKAAAKATAKAKMQAKAMPKTPGPKVPGPKVSPSATPLAAPVSAPAVAGLLPKTSAPSSPELQAVPAKEATATATGSVGATAATAPVAPAAPAAPGTAAPSGAGKGDEEDEAGCSQS
eukprot:symbB.v1.2.029637.t1/scaffold3271.1/size66959/2